MQLSDPMKQALKDVYVWGDASFSCCTRSEYGGRAGSLMALRRRKLLSIHNNLTQTGRAICVELFGEKEDN